LARYAYDPWGRRTVIAGTDVTSAGYAGHQWQSAANLSLAVRRGYDVNLGRWLSQDPTGLSDGPNTYAYVKNSTVNLIDPSGEAAAAVIGACRVAIPLVRALAAAVVVLATCSDCEERKRCAQVRSDCHESCWGQYMGKKGRKDIQSYFNCQTNCLDAARCGNYGGTSW
jgi:RHS repeat-associated protein